MLSRDCGPAVMRPEKSTCAYHSAEVSCTSKVFSVVSRSQKIPQPALVGTTVITCARPERVKPRLSATSGCEAMSSGAERVEGFEAQEAAAVVGVAVAVAERVAVRLR